MVNTIPLFQGRRPSPAPWADPRQTGAMLLELIIAMTVFTVGLLGFLFAFRGNFNATRDIGTRDLENTAFANAVETLLDSNFSTMYATYNGYTIYSPTGMATTDPKATDVGELVDASGNPAQVVVDFFVNEKNLPVEFGPIGDLDGDGLLKTMDCSGTYRLLPARLTLSYQTASGLVTRQVFLVIGNKTDT